MITSLFRQYQAIAYDGTNGEEIAAAVGWSVVSDDGQMLVLSDGGLSGAQLAVGEVLIWSPGTPGGAPMEVFGQAPALEPTFGVVGASRL